MCNYFKNVPVMKQYVNFSLDAEIPSSLNFTEKQAEELLAKFESFIYTAGLSLFDSDYDFESELDKMCKD